VSRRHVRIQLQFETCLIGVARGLFGLGDIRQAIAKPNLGPLSGHCAGDPPFARDLKFLVSEKGPQTSAICPFRMPRSLTTVLAFDNNFDNNAGGRPWPRRHGEDDSANTITGAPYPSSVCSSTRIWGGAIGCSSYCLIRTSAAGLSDLLRSALTTLRRCEPLSHLIAPHHVPTCEAAVRFFYRPRPLQAKQAMPSCSIDGLSDGLAVARRNQLARDDRSWVRLVPVEESH
jgi:hypothetical protein